MLIAHWLWLLVLFYPLFSFCFHNSHTCFRLVRLRRLHCHDHPQRPLHSHRQPPPPCNPCVSFLRITASPRPRVCCVQVHSRRHALRRRAAASEARYYLAAVQGVPPLSLHHHAFGASFTFPAASIVSVFLISSSGSRVQRRRHTNTPGCSCFRPPPLHSSALLIPPPPPLAPHSPVHFCHMPRLTCTCISPMRRVAGGAAGRGCIHPRMVRVPLVLAPVRHATLNHAAG